jgi:ABC-2 type transport system permease protein
MATTITSTGTEGGAGAEVGTTPTYAGPKPGRSAREASREAFAALLQRDLAVLKKNLGEFIGRTVIQPFLLVFVFLYVFPQIGQAVGGGSPGAESAFASVLIAGVVGISIMFQGIMAVALPLSTEFGYTKEIEDRVLAPMPIWMVAAGKVAAGAVQGLIAAAIVFPIAAVVHAKGVSAHLAVHWLILLTLLPLACVMCASFGLVLGTRVEPYYTWNALHHVQVGGLPWLQVLVLVNPLLYVTEGFRAALTHSSHMHLYVIYPVLMAICAFLLWQGLAGFRRRVLA